MRIHEAKKEDKMERFFGSWRMKTECWKDGYKYNISMPRCPKCGEESEEHINYLLKKRLFGYTN